MRQLAIFGFGPDVNFYAAYPTREEADAAIAQGEVTVQEDWTAIIQCESCDLSLHEIQA